MYLFLSSKKGEKYISMNRCRDRVMYEYYYQLIKLSLHMRIDELSCNTYHSILFHYLLSAFSKLFLYSLKTYRL